MASSLEELLAEEGFRSTKSMMRSRPSFQEQRRSGPASGTKVRTERARSDVSRNIPRSDRRPSDSGVRRDKMDVTSQDTKERHQGRSSNHTRETTKPGVNYRQDFTETEIVEVGEEEDDGRYKDIYSNDAYGSAKGNGNVMHRERSAKDIKLARRHSTSTSNKHMPGHASFNDNRKSTKQPETSQNRLSRDPRNSKSFGGSQNQKRDDSMQTDTELALDKVAIRAMISILSGYMKRFLKDEEFRAALRHNSFSSLSFADPEDGQSTESTAIANLEQAIGTVEKAAEESGGARDLKKASLQLSVITGLNLNDLKDGFTSGVPNSKLSACAHLYLSVIYKIQKKDRISAKHVLQVFCDLPSQARTVLLPDLWDHLFSPHLSHLKVWYNQEAESLPDTPTKPRKLALLNKVYNEILDSGTYQFAVYYKDWLTDGVETPSIPSILVPSVSVQGVQHGGSPSHSSELGSPSGPYSPQPMVSKKLYDAVFSRTSKPGVYEVQDDWEAENFDNGVRSSDGSVVEVKQTLTCSSEIVKYTDPDIEDATSQDNAILPSIRINPSFEESRGSHEYFDEGSYFSSIPQDFICPLTNKLFEDPVTLETGQTFERLAIREWFNEGHRTCPVTGKNLECPTVPLTNFVLKRVIDSWKTERCRHLLAFVSQTVESTGTGQGFRQRCETMIFILQQLLNAFSKEETATNVKHLISLGGLQFLIRMFEHGNLEERTQISALLSCCIKADANCRYQIATNINRQCLLELMHSREVQSRTNAVLLLTELICLGRRKDDASFLSGLQKEQIVNIMHTLLVYLQNSPHEHRPLVAVLLLHLDLLVEPQRYSIYRDEAVDAITLALEDSLTDEKVRENCCKALLVLGGQFSSSGKALTESLVLKQAGFDGGCEVSSLNIEEDGLHEDDTFLQGDEEQVNNEWLVKVSSSLLSDGKRPFLETISKSLSSGNIILVKVCLTTVAWLSCALSSLPDAEFQLSVFSALISQMKQILENDELVEHKILTSMSLLNFSKVPECRALLMEISDEIGAPLRSLAEVTWTARELHTSISGENL